jgi:hypothetical protein
MCNALARITTQTRGRVMNNVIVVVDIETFKELEEYLSIEAEFWWQEAKKAEEARNINRLDYCLGRYHALEDLFALIEYRNNKKARMKSLRSKNEST